ncbi:MAG: hypothetical protein COB08_018480 [Rhodobacteraceae bacterium]|nr:hypothetical protein [Paracoccaceae bacterium]
MPDDVNAARVLMQIVRERNKQKKYQSQTNELFTESIPSTNSEIGVILPSQRFDGNENKYVPLDRYSSFQPNDNRPSSEITPRGSGQSRLQFIEIGFGDVRDFHRRFTRKDIRELDETYRAETKGKPCANSEGIIRGLLIGGHLEDRVPTSAYEVAKLTDKTDTIQFGFDSFLKDNQLCGMAR